MDSASVAADASTQQEQGLNHAAGCARQRCFTASSGESTLHFQVIDLGRQYYVWVSAVGPKLGNLYLAINTPTDSKPAVATIVPGGAAGTSQSLAQRLALKVKKPVLCACNLPNNAPLLQAIAERRLLQELLQMEAGQGLGNEDAERQVAQLVQ